MIYYQTARKTPGKYPALHSTPTCGYLLKAGEVEPVELTSEQARKHKRCRYCFPTEGE